MKSNHYHIRTLGLLLVLLLVAMFSFSQTVPVVWESHSNTEKDPVSSRIRRNGPNTTPTFLNNEAILQNRFYPDIDGGYIRFKLNPSILEINDFRIVVEEYNYITNQAGDIVMIAELNNANMKFGNTFNSGNGRANIINYMPLAAGENQVFRIERTNNQLNLIRELTNQPINIVPVSVNPSVTLRVRANIWNRNISNYLISFVDIYETNLSPTPPVPHIDLGCAAPTLPAQPEDYNYSTLKTYDEQGMVNSVSRSYYDDMGKELQTQTSDISSQLVFTGQTLYDQMGRPVLQTLPAPKQNYTIGYQSGFIKESNGNNKDYTALSFDTPERKYSPRTVQNTVAGTLGYYYSINNTIEPYTPVTNFPYTRTEYYNDGTDRVKRVGLPSNQHRLGTGKEGFYASMPGSKELEHYYSLRPHFVPDGFVSANHQFAKEIVEDAEGKQSVVFTDGNGNTVATALVGSADLNDIIKPGTSDVLESKAVNFEYTLNQDANTQNWYQANPISFGYSLGANEPILNTLEMFYASSSARVIVYETDNYFTDFKKVFDGTAGDLNYNSSHNSYTFGNNFFFADAASKFILISDNPGTPTFIGTPYSWAGFPIPVQNEQLYTVALPSSPYYFEPVYFAPVELYPSLRNNTIEIHVTAPADIVLTNQNPGLSLTTDEKKIFLYDLKSYSSSPLMTDPAPYSLTTTTTTLSVQPGFYKIILNNTKVPVKVSYQLKYTDWAYYFYDDAGNPVGSVAPEGINFNSTANPNFKSTVKTNSLGQISESTETDIEGSNRFLYRKDGLIRFSQNPQQQEEGKFSYSNYDDFFRVTETGEAVKINQTDCFINIYNDISSTGNYNTVLDNNLTDFNNYNLTDRTIYSYDAVDETTPAPLTAGVFSYKNPSNPSDPLNNYKQRFLAGKISRVVKIDDAADGILSATWYSYNYQGKTEWTIQYIEVLGYKTIDYVYDDFTGLLTDVIYQKYFNTDRHEFTYYYDCNYRLKDAYSKTGTAPQQHEASYKYYKHGPLKRVELAKDNNGAAIQGIDYTYTILGALKAINEPTLTASKDPGQDGYTGSLNAAVQPDAFGMQLQYYNNDYNSSAFSTSFSNINNSGYSNGNIYAQLWKSVTNTGTYAYTYSYDYQNRMTNAYYRTTAITDNKHVLTSTSDYNERNITYDLNGNILGLRRNGFGTNINMDQLTYKYIANTNKLKQVTDSYTTPAYADDIESQPDANNYTYNKIGQLTGNKQESNQTISYNAYGTTKQLTKTQTTGGLTYTPSVRFYYDANGFRIKKVEQRPNTGTPNAYHTYITYYVNDASGNPLSIYSTDAQSVINKQEIPIYAAGRIGMATRNATTTSYSYELTDHLGNVRVTIPRNYNGTNVENIASYYPFGMQLPGALHSLTGTPYRYGYQGQFAEKDPETGFNSFEARMYDSRLGRWLTTDPAAQYWSPYLGMGNRPNMLIDPNGKYALQVTGFIIGAGIKSLELYKKGELNLKSAKTWGKIATGGLSGVAITLAPNLVAASVIASVSSILEQGTDNLIDGNEFKNINPFEVASSGIFAGIGYGIGGRFESTISKSLVGKWAANQYRIAYSKWFYNDALKSISKHQILSVMKHPPFWVNNWKSIPAVISESTFGTLLGIQQVTFEQGVDIIWNSKTGNTDVIYSPEVQKHFQEP